MRFRLAFLAFLLIGMGQSGLAGRAEDIRFLTGNLWDQALEKELRQIFGRSYAVHYDRWLRARSVKVIDSERFVAMLPDAATDKYMARYKKWAAERCFRKFSDAELAAAAEDIRANPERFDEQDEVAPLQFDLTNPQPGLDEMNKRLETVVTTLRDDARDRVSMASGLCVVMGAVKFGHAISANDELRLDPVADGLADILMTKGIAIFPNRIARQAVLRELRGLRDIRAPERPGKRAAPRETPYEPAFRRIPARKADGSG